MYQSGESDHVRWQRQMAETVYYRDVYEHDDDRDHSLGVGYENAHQNGCDDHMLSDHVFR